MDKLLKELEEQINKAEKEIKKMTKENVQLKDEVGSLWDLLDEMKASDVKNWAHLWDNN